MNFTIMAEVVGHPNTFFAYCFMNTMNSEIVLISQLFIYYILGRYTL